MAKVTENKPEPQPLPPSTYTVELSHDEIVRLAAMSFRGEHPLDDGHRARSFYRNLPAALKREAERLCDKTPNGHLF